MIKFDNVSFKYENEVNYNALKNTSFTIEKAEVVLFTGESGCGKTTIIRLINGLIPHYYEGDMKGKVEVCGKNPEEMHLYEIGKLVGSVYQNPKTQFYTLNTTSEMAFAAENQGLPKEYILNRIEKSVKMFKIENLKDRNIFELSGGEKQKIACASITVPDPEIIVLDEPSANLDSRSTQDLKNLISLWKEQGKTIIIAEHRLHYLKDLVDRIVIINNGEIIKDLRHEDLHNTDLREFKLRTLDLNNVKLDSNFKDFERKISFQSFDYCYDKKAALKAGEFSLPQNSVIGIIGENGAGKTTVCKCLCGLCKKFKGNISYNGKTIKASKLIKHSYMVMQDSNHQLFCESVEEEIALSQNNRKDKELTERILNEFNLTEIKDKHPLSLSGGQKQRVTIASAVASERDIIVFDEPTSGLDYYHMSLVAESIKKLQEKGITVLVITHDLELIMRICDYVLHLENGRIKDQYSLNEESQNKLKDFFLRSKLS